MGHPSLLSILDKVKAALESGAVEPGRSYSLFKLAERVGVEVRSLHRLFESMAAFQNFSSQWSLIVDKEPALGSGVRYHVRMEPAKPAGGRQKKGKALPD